MANERTDGRPTSRSTPAPSSTRAEIDAFLAKVKSLAPRPPRPASADG